MLYSLLEWKTFWVYTHYLMIHCTLWSALMNVRTGGPACFLIGDTVTPIPTQEGKVAKQHYAYKKNGSCCLLGAIEPLKGHRFIKVYPQRTKKDGGARALRRIYAGIG